MSRCSKHGTKWDAECDECEGKAPESARGSLAAPTLLAAVVEAGMKWRKCEKRWALIACGEIGGDEDLAKHAEEVALTKLRIAFDKLEAANEGTHP